MGATAEYDRAGQSSSVFRVSPCLSHARGEEERRDSRQRVEMVTHTEVGARFGLAGTGRFANLSTAERTTTPSVRFGSFRRMKPGRSVIAGLPHRPIRSWGFSPLQRFDPVLAARFYFTPLTPIGFRSSELYSVRSAVVPLGTRDSLAVEQSDCPLTRTKCRRDPLLTHGSEMVAI